MRFQRGLLLCCVALLLGSGCLLQKRRNRTPIQADKVEQVQAGKTTIAEVGRLLGAPNEIIWSNGVTTPVDTNRGAGVVNTFIADSDDQYPRVYHYAYTVEKISGFSVLLFSIMSYDTKYDDVFVFFDKNGRVTHMGTSLDSGEVSYSPFSS